MTPPSRPYKYESFSVQTLLNLKRQVIYFGSPLQFNDPYDCAIAPNIAEPNQHEIDNLRDRYLLEPDLPPKARQEFLYTPVPKLGAILVRAARSALQKVIDDFLAQRGVSCFSEKLDDLLMWSHYGGKYRGLCLEFDTSSEAFQKIHRVRYVPTLPKLSVASILFDRDFHPILELFCTKSEAWAYEREWRAIHHEAGKQYGYPSSVLTGVYFGPDIDSQALEIVCLVLAGQNESVKFWRGRRSPTDFKVDYELFTYTSYLEAKRRGLRG